MQYVNQRRALQWVVLNSEDRFGHPFYLFNSGIGRCNGGLSVNPGALKCTEADIRIASGTGFNFMTQATDHRSAQNFVEPRLITLSF